VGFCSFALSPSFSLHLRLRLVLCSFPISNSTCFIGFPDKLVRNSRGADRLLLRGENPESACFQDQKANGGGGKEIAQKFTHSTTKGTGDGQLYREGTAQGNLSLQVHTEK